MSVYRLLVAYDGAPFRGYARQDGLRTVQGELEAALATLLGAEIETSVAGRTDAGVHALGQVVSFQSDSGLDLDRALRGLNGILPGEISVRSVSEASDQFNARFSATWREYLYQIDMSPAPNPLRRRHVWHIGRLLNTDEMVRSAQSLVGEHDFSSFCRSIEGKSNKRNLTQLIVSESASGLEIMARANAFCHQMVRSLVGHLYDVGRQFADSESTAAVLAARDRSSVATVAPPHGLTLMVVGYPDGEGDWP